jgi:hypothetical protein
MMVLETRAEYGSVELTVIGYYMDMGFQMQEKISGL